MQSDPVKKTALVTLAAGLALIAPAFALGSNLTCSNCNAEAARLQGASPFSIANGRLGGNIASLLKTQFKMEPTSGVDPRSPVLGKDGKPGDETNEVKQKRLFGLPEASHPFDPPQWYKKANYNSAPGRDPQEIFAKLDWNRVGWNPEGLQQIGDYRVATAQSYILGTPMPAVPSVLNPLAFAGGMRR